MTDKPPPPSTQIANPSQILSPPTHAAPAQDAARKVEPTVEGEEPYTIKCICAYSDDDGNTIYCETCDTWQHIECFYPNNHQEVNRDDFAHSCHTCKPRQLDHQAAADRQRARLSAPAVEEETAVTKPKRPPSKNQKRKPKPTDLQLNGHPPAGDSSNKHSIAHDHHPPAKKAKSTHKPSQSVSHPAKRSPSYGNQRGNHPGHPPSPVNTPPELPNDFELHSYSPGFVSAYRDHDVQLGQTNSYAGLAVSNRMSLWLREPERMVEDTDCEYHEVFQSLPPDIDAVKQPPRLEHKKLVVSPDTVVRLPYLVAPAAIGKDVPLMELNGEIGFQSSYCGDRASRWDEISVPLPWVFFHPILPLYIDTRREGSRARYVRHSCKPNTVLDTYLSGGSQYQFWLVSDRPIAANEQITIPWDIRLPKHAGARWLRILGLGDDDSVKTEDCEIDGAEYTTIAGWIHSVLSEHGGCACDLGPDCAFERFHRNHYGKVQARPHPPRKKVRKPKTHAISPTSTGHATNSRAASEGHPDDGPDHDGRSTTDSARSKPQSRDITPPRQGSFDTLGILTEPTDRDKRKVAMVEDSFRRLEQQPPKKKKRISDGTGNPGPKAKPRTSTSHSAGLPNGVTYVDTGTSRSKSGSPASAMSPGRANPFGPSVSRPDSTTIASRRTSTSPRANYCDAGVQTDPVEGEWYSEPGQTPKPRRRIISLSKRLLDNRHRQRLDEEERRRHIESLASLDVATVGPETDVAAESKTASPALSADQDGSLAAAAVAAAADVPMPDAPSTSPSSTKPPTIVTSGAPGLGSPIQNRSPELRVQMPPVPTFNSSASATTPLSAGGMVHSPFATTLPSPFGPPSVNGMAASPSPVKKKLSLSDYTKSRKAAAGRPSVGTSLKTSTSNADDPKSASSADGGAGVDSPTTEKAGDAAAGVSAPPANGSL